MKKYLSFFRMRFLMGLQYRAAAAAGVVTQFTWGFMELLVFRAFYQADASAFPMRFEAVASYIWLQQALSIFIPCGLQEVSRTVCQRHCFAVRQFYWWLYFCQSHID